jgi:di/tricarboxylate transporter
MTTAQISILAILAVTLGLFVWGRLRVDVIAIGALLACVIAGVVPAREAFIGFGHPAVVTVAAVLALSSALSRAGTVDLLAQWLLRFARSQRAQYLGLTGLAGIMSAFMNNVGALALLMPVAISVARRGKYSPSLILMPLAFASILGGMITMIGTPPNLLIADFRRQATGESFQMFDFVAVGLPLAAVGILFLALIGWRLIPRDRAGLAEVEDGVELANYLTELRVPDGSALVGKVVGDLVDSGVPGAEFTVLALLRQGRRLVRRIRHMPLASGDVLLVHGAAEHIEAAVGRGLELVQSKDLPAQEAGEEADEEPAANHAGELHTEIVEVVVLPRARVAHRTVAELALRARYGVNLLAVARRGLPLQRMLRDIRLEAGDVLLLQGETDTLRETMTILGCLPLAPRELRLEPRRALLPGAIFAAAIAVAAFGLLEVAVALAVALLVLVVLEIMPMRAVYEAIDWQVIVLLGAMLPVGGALESTGTAALAANGLARLTGTEMAGGGAYLALALVLVATMFLSDVMNNAATAVLMAPIAIGLAGMLDTSVDPFLMAVAVGASAAFLTPIGHQNNLLVMGPGGYRFGDYWRVGLPLEAVLVVVAVPLIPIVWPF